MTSGKTILVLGGGIGGVVAASRLREQLAREHRVILIERETAHLFQPSLLWLMLGWRRPEQIQRPLSRLARHGIEVVQGNVDRIDPVRRAVSVNGRELVGDYLIVVLGAELAPKTVPGLAEAGHNLYTLAGATALSAARARFTHGKLVLLVSRMPFKCPAAPYEAALLLEYDSRRRGVRDRVSIDVYTPEPGPMPVAGEEVSRQVRHMVESKNIGYHPGHEVKHVDAQTKTIEFANGATAAFDLLVAVPPHRAPQVVRDAGLTAESGWVPVDRATLATKHPGVYAIGDVTGIALSIGKPLPKAGVFAHGEAEVVAHAIAAKIGGRDSAPRYVGNGECFLETGDGRAGLGRGNFFAEPAPRVRLHAPSRWLHWAKVWYEKYWLYRWF
jgi:sulfide:quinone oxidoreductase